MESATNSTTWWDNIFQQSWETNHGREQTYGFMHTLIASLPESELAYLLAHDLDIIDWGCAFGEGAATLSQAFPKSRIAGLDFSLVAVEEARKKFPDCEFIQTPNGEIPRDFDVIVTSNCLEHFAAPLDKVRAHLARCTTLFIAMVPFEEHPPLSGGHEFRFDLESFPEHLDDFARLSAHPLDIPRLYWPGQQLLVVYGSPRYLAQRSTQEVDTNAMRSIMELRIRLLEQERWRIANSLADSRQQVYDIWAVAQEKDVALARAYQDIGAARDESSALWALIQEKDATIGTLQSQQTQTP